MNPRNTFLLCVAAVAPLIASSAFADVEITAKDAHKAAPWDPTFAGGNLSINTLATFGTEGSTITGVEPNSGVIQTFKGDGKFLKGAGVSFASTTAPVPGNHFIVSVIDFGTVGPVDSPSMVNSDTTAVLAEKFRWNTTGTSRQYYFDLAAFNLKLDSTRYYAVVLEFPEAGGNNMINRSNNDAYPDGRLGVGNIGEFGFAYAQGSRDANFAVYTTDGTQ
jgi:hypothetical protein